MAALAMTDAQRAQDAIRRILARYGLVFSHREEGSRFWVEEVASRKVVPIETRSIDAFEEKESPGSGGPYLVLRRDDGQELVLCYAGFGFAPLFHNSGPIAGAPAVVCLRDFHTLLERLHALAPEREQRADALELIRFLIALLDGARAVGIDIGEEERALEAELAVVESR
jgi:hypothetical protein